MPRHAPGPWPSLIIILIATILFVLDRRRHARAVSLNQSCRCARCGVELTEPAHRVQVSGGPRFAETGFVCDGCYGTVRLHEKLFWMLLAAALVAVIVLEWQRTHF
jgi:hypothetical protein